MKRFSERNTRTIGLVGVGVIALVLVGALNVGPLARLLAGATYEAAFTDAAGLAAGSEVRVSGLKVGSVQDIRIDGPRVVVKFTAADVHLGDRTRAAIKAESALAGKFLALYPRGQGELDEVIPVDRTVTPYSLTDAVQDASATAGRIDTGKLAQSFDTLAQTFADSPKRLRGALEGVRRLSATIASRDEALGDLLASANGVTGLLAERSGQITTIMADGNKLLAELQARRDVIDRLLADLTALSDQVSGLVKDNRATLKPTLSEVRKTLAVLNKNRDNLQQVIEGIAAYAKSLGETVGGGPFFYALVQNLAPTNLAPLLPELLEKQPSGSKGTR